MTHTAVRIAAALALAASTLTPALAQSSDGAWLVRARAVYLDAANKDSVDVTDVSINNKWLPEVDISYFFTPNIAAELILTYPQKHNVKLNGDVIGSLRHLPPTLTAQYHFMPNDTAIRPYVGVGLNYTNFSSVSLPNLGGAIGQLNVKRSSFGWALQAGMDVPLTKNWSLNVDVKKVQIRAEVQAQDGSEVDTLKVDPLLIGVGLGYRF